MVPTQSVGTFNQTGGAVMVTGAIVIGQDEDFYGGECGECVGTYNFTGGTLTDGGYGANLYVRYDAPATGTFHGHGVVAFTGTLQNNGRVIANGGTLNLSSFSSVTSTVPNVAQPFNGGIHVAGSASDTGSYLYGDYSYVTPTTYQVGGGAVGAFYLRLFWWRMVSLADAQRIEFRQWL